MAPAGLRLVLSEKKVRARSGLAAGGNLAELRSLSIPGTYQEKITHLGNSLMNLTGLTSLDLSRNSLVSLEGIQYLVVLESLNLYYNCISSLAEVFRLHTLTELRDVDFRLNPVVKNASDYRLFVVHMLPKLRQLGAADMLNSQKSIRPMQRAPEKYRKQRVPGRKIQVPLDQACQSCLGRTDGPPSATDSLSRQDSLDSRSEVAFSQAVAEAEEQGHREPSPKLHTAALARTKAMLDETFLEAFLDLVSRHGCGCRALLGNEAFLAQARHILSSAQAFTATQDSSVVHEEISHLALENKSLQNHLAGQQQQHHTKVSELMAQLSMSHKELDDSKKRLDRSLEENSSLKSLLFSMKKEVEKADTLATLSLQLSGLQASVEQLSGELAELKQHLEHYNKIQELIRMLQESHRSLCSEDIEEAICPSPAGCTMGAAPWSTPMSTCCKSWARHGRSTRRRCSSCTGATRSSRRPWPCSHLAASTLGLALGSPAAQWSSTRPRGMSLGVGPPVPDCLTSAARTRGGAWHPRAPPNKGGIMF
ncbi:centrosomal protein of 72 kDa isoform X6 [Tamandua tetradactyla]|uniref:centrosomal protein of 72 kDa isoform X6 n=1 Tax=Tamandua tetradactyla TaxID=48850 RepID=UPI004053E3F5